MKNNFGRFRFQNEQLSRKQRAKRLHYVILGGIYDPDTWFRRYGIGLEQNMVSLIPKCHVLIVQQ